MSNDNKDVVNIEQSNQILDLFGNIQDLKSEYFIDSVADATVSGRKELNTDDMCFFQVKKLSYDEDYPRREAFENVLFALDNEAYNFIYMLTGSENGVELHIGTVKNHKTNKSNLSAVNCGQIIESVFEGNFSGSTLERMDSEELKAKVLDYPKKFKEAGIITGIPSINESDTGDEYDFQGVDRLINSMLGLKWRIIVVCEPVEKKEILEMKEDIYELYNRLSLYSKMSVQNSVNSGDNFSFGKNVSESHGKNRGWSESDTNTHGKGNISGTKNSSTSKQFGRNGGDNQDHTKGSNVGYSRNKGSSQSVTLEIANKHAQDIMKYIDDELLTRIKLGYSKGLYKTSLYYMSDKPTSTNRLKVAIMSLFQGNRSTFSPLNAQQLNMKNNENLMCLSSYQNSCLKRQDYYSDAMLLLGRPSDNMFGLSLSSYLTTSEISILAGLPQKEVPGISLKEGVDFGLNERHIKPGEGIELGLFVQKGRSLSIPFSLSKSSLIKHTFVAGVTGSGKTTTCHKLLSSAHMPFLVIEPAKTEYRTLASNPKFGKVFVFTLGNEGVAPFRINPFELIKGEVISAHVDMLKATFTSAFPMEASMPQILEEAMYKCYEKKGWNIDTNTNDKYDDPFEHKESCFPIISELLEVMKEIVKTKGFSPQMQADYEGSLVSRLSNLTVGSKGRMLNCSYSIDFHFIAYNNVVIEMEELKSPEDKALFMGFILSRLSAVIKEEHKHNSEYRHLTLIEEAHRLLTKVEYGDNGSKKAAVETFTDLLAEVRKYGEGLIVVDQIPNKLAPDVLKNTNTKIIHKILAKDDKEAVGDTMLMDDKQKEYLSALETGHAIVFSEDTEKPVHVFIQRTTDTNGKEISDDYVGNLFQTNRCEFGSVYEDLEILPYYSEFADVSDQIARMIIDNNRIKKIKKLLEAISGRTNVNKLDIWKQFIIRKERISSNSFNDCTEQIIEQLSDYLFVIFEKEEVVRSDLNYKMCRKLL